MEEMRQYEQTQALCYPKTYTKNDKTNQAYYSGLVGLMILV